MEKGLTIAAAAVLGVWAAAVSYKLDRMDAIIEKQVTLEVCKIFPKRCAEAKADVEKKVKSSKLPTQPM